MASNPEQERTSAMPGERTSAWQRQALTTSVVVMAGTISAIVAIEAAAGLPRRQINAGLAECLNQGLITRIVVTDEHGTVEYSSDPDLAFTFPDDPSGDAGAAEFLELLDGSVTRIVQPAREGEGGDALQDVAVCGRDKPRIVQVRHRLGVPDMTVAQSPSTAKARRPCRKAVGDRQAQQDGRGF